MSPLLKWKQLGKCLNINLYNIYRQFSSVRYTRRMFVIVESVPVFFLLTESKVFLKSYLLDKTRQKHITEAIIMSLITWKWLWFSIPRRILDSRWFSRRVSINLKITSYFNGSFKLAENNPDCITHDDCLGECVLCILLKRSFTKFYDYWMSYRCLKIEMRCGEGHL